MTRTPATRTPTTRTPTTRDYLSISVFWLAVSFFWGALLFGVLQSRVQTFVENEYSKRGVATSQNAVSTSLNSAKSSAKNAIPQRAVSSSNSSETISLNSDSRIAIPQNENSETVISANASLKNAISQNENLKIAILPSSNANTQNATSQSENSPETVSPNSNAQSAFSQNENSEVAISSNVISRDAASQNAILRSTNAHEEQTKNANLRDAVSQNANAKNAISHAEKTPNSSKSKHVAFAENSALKAADDARKKQIEADVAFKLSVLLGSGALVSVATQLLFGALSDRMRSRFGRRKPFVVAGTLLASVAIVAFGFVRDYPQLFAVFLLIQFFINIASGPFSALLPDTIPAQFHGKAAAFLGIFSLVGRTGGNVAGLTALLKNHLDWLVVAFLVFLNAAMLATVFLVKEAPHAPKSSTRNGILGAVADIFRVDLRGQSSFVWVLVSRFVINTGVYTIMPFLLFYLMNCYDLTQTAALTQMKSLALLVNFTGMAATFPAGIAGDRTSKKRVVYATCVLCIAGGLGFVFSHSIPFAMISAGIFGLGYGAFSAIDWALVCNVLPPGDTAKYMGLWSCADNVPQIVAPFLGGAVATWAISHYDAATGYRAVMLTAIVWFALGTLCIRFVRERSAQEIEDVAAKTF